MEETKHNKFFAGKKIMWVEDDEFFSSLMIKKLSETGCTLVFTPTGEEAIKRVSEEKPDLIILDLLLPGINGFKVLENIRLDESLKNTPIMILSNLGGQENIEHARSFGIEKYLIKTDTNLGGVMKEIEEILRKKNLS